MFIITEKKIMSEIRHIGIVVQNLKKVSNFFINDLGFKIHKQINENTTFIDKILGLKNTKLTTLKLKSSGNCLVELLKFKNYPHKSKWNGKLHHTGITQIALTVKNVNFYFLKFNKKYKFISEPTLSDDKKAKVVFFHGPENIIFELVELL